LQQVYIQKIQDEQGESIKNKFLEFLEL
jgi:hypothetical protein